MKKFCDFILSHDSILIVIGVLLLFFMAFSSVYVEYKREINIVESTRDYDSYKDCFHFSGTYYCWNEVEK